MSNDNELPEADDEGIWYRWRCPNCGETNESEEDTRGQEVECDACLKKAYHNS